MKKILLILSLLFFTFSFAQTREVIKEKDGDKVVFYRQDGTKEQEGYFKNGKVHGDWVFYNRNGSIKMSATYNEGIKEGTWLFKHKDTLKEVLYEDNQIITVNIWKKNSEDSLANN